MSITDALPRRCNRLGPAERQLPPETPMRWRRWSSKFAQWSKIAGG